MKHSAGYMAGAFPRGNSLTISIGDRLPEGKFRIMTDDGQQEISTDDIFRGKKVVLFGVPGAFTPTCSRNHLPGFLEHAQNIRDKGIDTIAVIAVNDVHVMNAWAKANRNDGRILFLADGSGTYAKALGVDVDIPGMGIRCRRFSMIVEDGIVREMNFEEGPGKVDLTSAATILKQIA
jgi:peroxiredoxin